MLISTLISISSGDFRLLLTYIHVFIVSNLVMTLESRVTKVVTGLYVMHFMIIRCACHIRLSLSCSLSFESYIDVPVEFLTKSS